MCIQCLTYKTHKLFPVCSRTSLSFSFSCENSLRKMRMCYSLTQKCSIESLTCICVACVGVVNRIDAKQTSEHIEIYWLDAIPIWQRHQMHLIRELNLFVLFSISKRHIYTIRKENKQTNKREMGEPCGSLKENIRPEALGNVNEKFLFIECGVYECRQPSAIDKQINLVCALRFWHIFESFNIRCNQVFPFSTLPHTMVFCFYFGGCSIDCSVYS